MWNNFFQVNDLVINHNTPMTEDKSPENHRFVSLRTYCGEEILGWAPNTMELSYFWKRVNTTSIANMVNRFNFRNQQSEHCPYHNEQGILIKGKVFFVVVWALVCSSSSQIYILILYYVKNVFITFAGMNLTLCLKNDCLTHQNQDLLH